MAVINRKLNPGLETMFLASSEKYTYLSSTIVKEMARYGAGPGRVSLPREIVDDVNRRMSGTAGKEGLTMASGVEELLDMLFDMVDEAKNVPLSSDRCMIDAGPGPGPDRRHPGPVPGGAVRGQEGDGQPGGPDRLRQAGGRGHPPSGGGEGQAV